MIEDTNQFRNNYAGAAKYVKKFTHESMLMWDIMEGQIVQVQGLSVPTSEQKLPKLFNKN